MGNSTPCKIVPAENIIFKLCIRDYVARLPAMLILVSIGTMGVSPQIGEILPFCDFFDCPVLSLPFFSILCSGRTAGPIFTLYGSNDVFPQRMVLLGVRTMDDRIRGECAPKTPPKWV